MSVCLPPVTVVHDGEPRVKGARRMTWDGSRDSSVVKELLLNGGGLQGYGGSGVWLAPKFSLH